MPDRLRLSRRLPAPVRSLLRTARLFPAAQRLAVGADSRSRYWRMLHELDSRNAGPPEPVRIRSLGGESVLLRPGTVDAEVALSTFAGEYHLPPNGTPPPEVIWDLGANIGLTMRHMASVYPRARLFGVELDEENVRLAARNLEPCSDRCELLTAALWASDGEVSYARSGPVDGYRVSEEGDRAVTAVTMNRLLELFGRPDYVKMDVEGAEREVLRRETDWAEAVPVISVECHPPYSLDACAEDLERLGYEVELHPQSLRRRARDCAIGVRPSA